MSDEGSTNLATAVPGPMKIAGCPHGVQRFKLSLYQNTAALWLK